MKIYTQVYLGLRVVYKYHFIQQQWSGSLMSWQTRERPGPTVILEEERERGRAHSHTAADERSKVKHITQGLYRMKLVFSYKALEITTWWVSHIQGHLAMLFAT